MVRFKADAKFFVKSLRYMNELRQNEEFCDVSLIVGARRIKAHRCVLAAGSSYFNVLFLGQFTEASMNEINLTEVTENVDALEMIVNFLYTGEIHINSDNLGVVVKLASYFLIETLVKFCSQFIVNSLSLITCLKYHLYAIDYGLMEIEAKTRPMLKARFHDYIMFEEDTLNLSPKDLLYLKQNKVFEFCSHRDLLKFIFDWVRKGLTDKHVSVGSEVLESFGCVMENDRLPLSHTSESDFQTACDEMIAGLKHAGVQGHEKFVQRVSRLRQQCFRPRDLNAYGCAYNLRMLPNSTPTLPVKDLDHEDVIITLSPRPCVADHFENYEMIQKGHERPYNDAVFDICAYVPSTKFWYHLGMVDDEQDLYTLLDENSLDDWIFAMRPNELVFASVSGMEVSSMTQHNLGCGTWEKHTFGDQVDQHLEENESCNDFCLVNGSYDTLYMITVINRFEDEHLENCVELFFRCFRYEDTSHIWKVMFDTRKYPVSETDFSVVELHASISSTSNEMLVAYCDKMNACRNIFIVVNLASEIFVPVTLLDSAETNTSDPSPFRTVSVVQGKKQFFILYDTLVDDKRMIKVEYEYKFNSNKLIMVETAERMLGETELIQRGNQGHFDGIFYTPCLTELSLAEQESAWYICGDKGSVSSLTEVTVNRCRTPVVKSHTPPPFSSITAAFAGKVTRDIQRRFKPVRFLGKKDTYLWRNYPWDHDV